MRTSRIDYPAPCVRWTSTLVARNPIHCADIVPTSVIDLIGDMISDQGALRSERNRRVHHGVERGFTNSDLTFRVASTFETKGGVMKGKSLDGRPINLDRSFKEGLVELQRDFNATSRKPVRRLDALYDLLYREFQGRFSPKFKARTRSFGAEAIIKIGNARTTTDTA